MPVAEIPENEKERIAAVYELRLLDTPPEERFDRISRLASQVLRLPMAYVALLEGERQWFKSVCGLDMTHTERRTSLCSHTILTMDGILCPDTHLEPRFADNQYVQGEPHVRAYFGIPLRTPSGYAVGTFCAMGFEPRTLSEEEISMFRSLASLAESELNLMDLLTMQQELRRTLRLLQESLHYAQLIQRALLAKIGDLARVFPDFFAFWQPRDIVGGDYYTLHLEQSGRFVLTVADCTGHGVPGAFMSMASKALLDRAVARYMGDPAALLGELHQHLRALLSQDEPGSHNGLDIAVVCGRIGDPELIFAAAKLELWIQAVDGSFEVLKGDRQSIGYASAPDRLEFSNHYLPTRSGQRYFLLSDGILDQSGGPRGFGMGKKRLQEALSSWKNEPLAQVERHLQDLLRDYMGSHAQRDDITLVGFSPREDK